MSDTTSTQFVIPDAGEQVFTQETQYGMRFPDGSIQWKEMNAGLGRTIRFKAMHEDGTGSHWFKEYTERQAQSVRMDPKEYHNNHHLVSRTVLLALTKAEDV